MPLSNPIHMSSHALWEKKVIMWQFAEKWGLKSDLNEQLSSNCRNTVAPPRDVFCVIVYGAWDKTNKS